MSSQSAELVCPKCQRPLPAGAPEGMCPVCLFENMLTPPPEAPETAGQFEPGESRLAANRQFGQYELQDEIARGGMGIVYRARHLRLNRVVALKMVLSSHLAGESSARRFRLEAEATASLDHPNIVPIYEVGETDGRLFYTMKLAEGGPLSRHIESLQLRAGTESNGGSAAELARRKTRLIQIMLQVARAVRHAHERGLLHRDLKPSNILLTADGEPAVTDFGLARWIEGENELTVSGTVVGSPSYMAPEQAAGRAHELTTATDVYGLGAVLFYLLTGRAPFAEETAVATMRAVAEREAPRPSSLNPAVDRDLDTICLKCLAKDPARRYQSARALAEDLERVQRGEPILARPATPWEHARKWARRNPALALLTLVLVAAPVVIITLLAASNRRVQQAQVLTRLNLYAADMQVAQTALEDANLALARQILENHRPRPGEPDLRGFEWRYLWQRAQSGQLRVLRQHSQPVNCVQFSPDGHWLASCEVGRTVWFWNTTTWKPERVIDWSGESSLPFRWVSFSRDSTQVALTLDGYYCPLFDFNTLQSELCIFAREMEGAYLPRLLWSPVSDKLVFHSVSSRSEAFIGMLDWAGFKVNPGRRSPNRFDGFVTEWHATASAGSFPDAPITKLADTERLFGFTRTGELLAGRNGEVLIYDVEKGGAVSKLWSAHRFDYAELSANGKYLAGFNSLPKDRHSVLMDEFIPGYTNYWEMIGHDGDIRALAIAPDSRRIGSGSADHTARVWDVATRKTVATLRGHADEVTTVAWSPDGQLIATGSKDRTVMLWSVTGTNQSGLAEPISGLYPPWVVAADGSAVAGFSASPGAGAARKLAIVSLADNRWMEIADDTELTPLFLTASGGELLWVKPTVDGGLELHRRNIAAQTSALVRTLPVPGAKTANLRPPLWAISPDCRWLARTGEQGTVDVWSLVNPGEPAQVIAGNGTAVTQLAFSPEGSALAIGSAGERIGLWFPASDQQPAARTLAGELSSLAWSPDGKRLALVGEDRTIRISDPVSGQELQTLVGHKRLITALAYSPDGRTLASADGRTIKLWHAETGREMLTIHRDQKIGEAVQWLEFTPDGNRLLAGDSGGRVMVFAATPIREF